MASIVQAAWCPQRSYDCPAPLAQDQFLKINPATRMYTILLAASLRVFTLRRLLLSCLVLFEAVPLETDRLLATYQLVLHT